MLKTLSGHQLTIIGMRWSTEYGGVYRVRSTPRANDIISASVVITLMADLDLTHSDEEPSANVPTLTTPTVAFAPRTWRSTGPGVPSSFVKPGFPPNPAVPL